jgi:VWFA-related protein
MKASPRFPVRTVLLAAGLLYFLVCAGSRPAAQQQPPPPVFRSETQLVTVDVVVRDSSGSIVRGLTAGDFTVLEDGRPQRIETFTFQEILDGPRRAPGQPVTVLAGVEERLRNDVQRAPGTAAAADPAATVFRAADVAGRRLVVLLFDVSSMQPDNVQRAVDSGLKFAQDQMAASDLVSVVTIGSTITVLTDFTDDPEAVRTALQALALSDGTATPAVEAVTAALDDAEVTTDAGASGSGAAEESGFDTFNNDVRLRGLKTIAETLAPIEQKKAIIYFTAGMARVGEDNQVELRAALNAANRANVAIYPVDARGLEAVVPGGDASRPSGRGVSLFTGRGVQQQFARLIASQGTLATLANDTGGRAFTDVNEFGEAFTRVQRDLSAYYLLGYRSTNTTRDGRFRRIQVRVDQRGLRVEARNGYYADRDFANTNRRDREAQLEEQLAAAVSSTDIPVVVGTGWFRMGGPGASGGRGARGSSSELFYVPIAMAVPGSAVPVPPGAATVAMDVRGMVMDERGRAVGRIRETLTVPASGGTTLAGRQVLYQSDVTLPPGRFTVKIVVRENTTGLVGSFEAPILVPRLTDDTVKLSSVMLSTQLRQETNNRSGNPLVRDGVQLLPNLTRVVGRHQNMYFYYEVYDPAVVDRAPQLRTSLAFYRGSIKVFETPLVEREAIDDPQRRAVIFQFEVPAGAFAPGTYTSQVNIIDAVAARVAFPRLTFHVHDR